MLHLGERRPAVRIAIDENHLLKCPVCRSTRTRINEVRVDARRTGGPFTDVVVDVTTGRVESRATKGTPAGLQVGTEPCSRVALLVSCEDGHRFAVAFTQREGSRPAHR